MFEVPPIRAIPTIGQGGTGPVKIGNQFLRFLEQLVLRVDGAFAPVGSVQPYLGTTAPDGWLLANGATLEKRVYPALYDVIGGTWGETATTFNLPDLSGQTINGEAVRWLVKV